MQWRKVKWVSPIFQFISWIKKIESTHYLVKDNEASALSRKSFQIYRSPLCCYTQWYDQLRRRCSKILVGPLIEERTNTTTPFYISLNIHDFILHKWILDLGSSHNLIPEAIMEKLVLDITKPYRDLYAINSRKVKCLGVRKYLVINLT